MLSYSHGIATAFLVLNPLHIGRIILDNVTHHLALVRIHVLPAIGIFSRIPHTHMALRPAACHAAAARKNGASRHRTLYLSVHVHMYLTCTVPVRVMSISRPLLFVMYIIFNFQARFTMPLLR